MSASVIINVFLEPTRHLRLLEEDVRIEMRLFDHLRHCRNSEHFDKRFLRPHALNQFTRRSRFFPSSSTSPLNLPGECLLALKRGPLHT